jgi:putative transposase
MVQSITELLRRIVAFSVRYLKRLSRPTNCSVGSGAVVDVTRSKKELLAENVLLRQQLIILKRGQKRPVLSNWDRIKLVCLARLTPSWRQILHIVKPDTLLRWHRDLFRMVWPFVTG